MPKAIRVHKPGGPDVMVWEDISLPSPGPGEVLLRHTAIGVNYVDTYHRSGLYPVTFPSVLGSEGAGVVEAMGPGVTSFKIGDRVAYGNAPIGAYSEKRLIPADRLVLVPDTVTDHEAAAMMLKGLTAHYLLRKTYYVRPGDTVLFHAAAGGVGLIFGQWAKYLGAKVIGTAGSLKKAEIAKAHGYDHVILYRETSFVDEVMKITGQQGVPVVYDGVGKDTFMASLDCLQPRGLMVSFGNASGAVPPFSLGLLAQKGSLYLTRPTLATYVKRREDLLEAAEELFSVVSQGYVKIGASETFALKDAGKAHAQLEARATTGSVLLIP